MSSVALICVPSKFDFQIYILANSFWCFLYRLINLTSINIDVYYNTYHIEAGHSGLIVYVNFITDSFDMALHLLSFLAIVI